MPVQDWEKAQYKKYWEKALSPGSFYKAPEIAALPNNHKH